MTRALLHAAHQGHVHCLRLLLQEKAPANAVGEAGLAPLHLACSQGHVACVRVLVAHGADAQQKAPDGRSCAEMARSPAVLAALTASATSASAVEGRLEGYLYKSSGREKTKAKHWQKRWFVLSDGVLSYYKTRKDVKPAGEIELERVSAAKRADSVTKKTNSLQLVTRQRTFYFCADEEETIEQWRQAVEQARGTAALRKSIVLGEEPLSPASDSETQEERTSEGEEGGSEQDEGQRRPHAWAAGSLEALPPDEPARHMEQFGFLFKAGGKKGQAGHWQKRWVVLDSGCLSYYRKQTDTKPAGVILLATVLRVEEQDEATKKENSFCVETPERTFYFYGTTDAHREKWVEAINNNRRAVAEEEQAAFVEEQASLAAALNSPRTLAEEEEELLLEGRSLGKGKEGFLWKTPGKRKKPGNWQRRWFVLSEASLDYFRAPKDAKAAGQVSLSSVTHVVADDEAKANGFNVHTPERIYFLYAPSPRERDVWVATIVAALQQ